MVQKQMEQPWSERCWGVNGGAAVALFLIFLIRKLF